jgi:hypothetical protein
MAKTKVDAVPGDAGPRWDKLVHARGTARDLPALLAALADGGAAAYAAVEPLLTWQGKLFSATGPALAVLVELAADPTANERARMLALVHAVLHGGAPKEPADASVIPVAPGAKVKGAKPGKHPAADAVRAVAAVAPTLRALATGDADDAVRGQAIQLLVDVDDPADLAAIVAAATSPSARASAFIACFAQCARAPKTSAALAALLTKAAADPDEAPLARGVALAARAALAHALPPKSDAALAAFFAEVVRPGAHAIPFAHGRPDLFVLDAVARAGQDARLAVAAAAAPALVAPELPYGAAPRGWHQRILAWFFAPRRWPQAAVAPAQLTAVQRTVLGLFADRSTGRSQRVFRTFGLPDDLEARRRLIGRAPATLLERVVAYGGKRAPMWQHFPAIKQKHEVAWERARKAGKPLPAPFATFAAALPDVPPAEWLELFMDVTADLYELSLYGDTPECALIDQLSPAELRGFLDRWMARLDRDDELRYHAWWKIAYAWTRALGPDAPLPEALDRFVTLVHGTPLVEAMYRRFPVARRRALATRIVDDLTARRRGGDGSWVGHIIDGLDEELPADIFPNARAERRRFDDLAKADARAAAAAAQPPRRAKRKAAARPAPAPAYVFTNPRTIRLRDVARLTPIARAQFVAAARAYDGKRTAAPADFFAREAKSLDERPDQIRVGRWDICAAAAPRTAVFEMWVFLVDNGSVFHAGTRRDAGVHMIQGEFQPRKRTPLAQQLAEQLQAVVPF